MNSVLSDKGYDKISKTDYIEFISLLMNCTEDDLKRLYTDKTLPFVLRIMIGDLNNKSTRTAMIRDLRDFAFGKAAESMNLKTEVEGQPLTKEQIVNFSREYYRKYLIAMPDDKLDEELRRFKKLEIEHVSKDPNAAICQITKDLEDNY